mgnify:CR=1 FL=1
MGVKYLIFLNYLHYSKEGDMLRVFKTVSFVRPHYGDPDKTERNFLRCWGEWSAAAQVAFEHKLARDYKLYSQKKVRVA